MAQTLKDNRVLLQVEYFGAAEFLGLRQIHRIGNDVYLGN
jgi:hypothetical protein